MAPVVQCARKMFMWCYAVLMATTMTIEGKQNHSVLNKEAPTPTMNEGCWVFLHMPKSGGTTIKTLLHMAAHANNIRQAHVMDNDYINGASGRREAEKVLRQGKGMVYGGYAETLRASFGDSQCKWFTVFRHPVSRLVSAYFYCKFIKRGDSLCHEKAIDLDTIDIASFAEHWGNYGLRQYALAFFSADDLLASRASKTCKNCPGWFRVKRYLENLQQQVVNDNVVATPSNFLNDDSSLYAFLEPALEIISSRYAAVGILENLNTTMHLFDSTLGIPNFSWTIEIENVGEANSDHKRKDQEHAALLEASIDPSVIRFIWLDIILYEHALSIHASQAKKYGLTNP